MTREEAAAILALLEVEYATEKEAAAAVYNGVVDILRQRHSFGIGLDGIAWGPFYSLTEAKATAKQIGGKVAKLYAPGPLEIRLATPVVNKQACDDCEHPIYAHIERKWTEWKGEKWAREPGCSVPRCQCPLTFSYPARRAA